MTRGRGGNGAEVSEYRSDKGRLRKIRFVSTGENRAKPCLVCTKHVV